MVPCWFQVAQVAVVGASFDCPLCAKPLSSVAVSICVNHNLVYLVRVVSVIARLPWPPKL